jgi:hypothetical protein
MPTSPPSSAPVSRARTLPAGQTETHFNSAYVEVADFVFNPTLVAGFLHRRATEESIPVTEVFYASHHVSVDDPQQALYFFLRQQTNPQGIKTTT